MSARVPLRTGGLPDSREQIDTWSELPAETVVEGMPHWLRLHGPNQFFDEATLPGYKANGPTVAPRNHSPKGSPKE